MIQIFHSDLDNTLIYSYKNDQGEAKRWVEQYQGKEVSFMTPLACELLKKISRKLLFVPTTTRTAEQYARITFADCEPVYALVCNGGILLKQGQRVEEWYQESLRSISDCAGELCYARELLAQDPYRSFELRNIEELFLFTKSSQPEKTKDMLECRLDGSLVEVLTHGSKLYVVPRTLNKGEAVRRFRKRMGASRIFAAGDSAFDVSMLLEADIGLWPEELAAHYASNMQGKSGASKSKEENMVVFSGPERFSDKLLSHIIRVIEE